MPHAVTTLRPHFSSAILQDTASAGSSSSRQQSYIIDKLHTVQQRLQDAHHAFDSYRITKDSAGKPLTKVMTMPFAGPGPCGVPWESAVSLFRHMNRRRNVANADFDAMLINFHRAQLAMLGGLRLRPGAAAQAAAPVDMSGNARALGAAGSPLPGGMAQQGGPEMPLLSVLLPPALSARRAASRSRAAHREFLLCSAEG